METLIILIWFLLVLLNPFAFFVTSYISYLKENQISHIIVSLLVSLLIHIGLTTATTPFMFIVIFAGAHTNPTGNALDWKGKLIFLGIDLVFIISGLLLSSLILQKIIKPWQIKFHFGKMPSIFDNN